MDENNVGVVSLDLIINKKIAKTLNDATAEIQGKIKAVEESTKIDLSKIDIAGGNEVSGKIKNALEVPFTYMGKTVEEWEQNVEKSSKKVSETIAETLAEANKATAQTVKSAPGKNWDAVVADIKAKERKDTVVSTTGPPEVSFKASSDAAELLKQKSENIKLQIEETTRKLAKLSEEFSKMSDADMGTDEAEALGSKITAAEGKLISLQQSLQTTGEKLQKAANSGAANVAKSSSKAANVVNKTLADTSQKAKNSIKNTVGAANKSLSGFGKSFKSLAKSALLMTGVLAVLKGLKNAIGDTITYNREFYNSLKLIKGNLTVAFTPIMQSIMPALNMLMDGLAAGSKALAEFTAKIFGTSYKESVKATQQAQASAAAIKKSMSTASFDELKVKDSSADDSVYRLDNAKYDTSIFDSIKAKIDEVIKVAASSELWGKIKKTANTVFEDVKKLGTKFGKWFKTDFKTYFKTAATSIDNILTGLLDSFNTVFNDIWSIAVRPILDKFISEGLPAFTEFKTEGLETLNSFYGDFKSLFDKLWAEAAAPALGALTEIWLGTVTTICNIWDEYGAPVFEGIRTAFTNMCGIFETIWDEVGKPVWDNIVSTILSVWNEHLQPFFEKLGTVAAKLADLALTIYNNFVAPVVKFIVDVLAPPITAAFETISNVVKTVIGVFVDVASDILDVLGGLIDFVKGVFTGDWELAWNGIRDIFEGIWKGLVDIVKGPINLIIDAINGLVNGVCSGLNAVIRMLNKISFDVPDWVPGIGGEKFGFNIQELTAPKIPKLATGGIIQQPTLAMVGEAGKEAVLPLENNTGWMDTFVEKLANRLINLLGGVENEKTRQVADTIKIVLELDGAEIFEKIVAINEIFKRQTGHSAFT